MKTVADIKAALNLALIDWFRMQCENPLDDYYMYYLPATTEHDSGLVVCRQQPHNREFLLAWPERLNKGKTVDEVFTYHFERCMLKLPLLSYTDEA